MSTKTPRQIAEEHGPEGMHNLIPAERVRAYMVAAVEADRAQCEVAPDPNDYVVDLVSRVAIKLESSRIVRNFSPELHAEDPEAIAFYAEAHGQRVR